MAATNIGDTLARLRKDRGMTQKELAEKLNVSDKTVSKWEKGQSYPDVTIFPLLSSIFGVSIDYLMLNKKGITVAGNMIADVVKSIVEFPKVGMLTHINDISLSVGGCAPNTAIDLARIDPRLPVNVCGMVGTDENGRFILSTLQKHGINVDRVCALPNTPTSFCDVMSMPSGERTFFHKKGTNAEFSPAHIDIKGLNCDIFHIGYILLLDKFDAPDPEYGTVMARFLKKVQQSGIKTSIDVVSDNSADYGKAIAPALAYCDYVIINEIECCNIWGLDAYDDAGNLNRQNIRLAMEKAVEAGLRNKVIVHSKTVRFLLDGASGEFIEVPSLKIPPEEIKGSVGAGDAFCAGCLYGLYNHFPSKRILEFASAAAACNLFAANSIDGMKSRDEIFEMENKYERIGGKI